jgi:glycosyltransferase involved in cell wall biosynthesis
MSRVSIAINNYNYQRFVAEAIDSALAQRWPDLEVIVIDDGSTDDSWAVIQSYGDRIKAQRTANGGQGAAYNAGFAQCTGDWVLFLDSDDLLDPDAVARCMAAVRDEPRAAKVQFRLRTVDAAGGQLGGFVPFRMHSGDVTPTLRRFGHYAGPPASGNFYRRSAIAPYFPMEASAWRRASDTVPYLLCAFHGPVISIDAALGSYRLHRKANSQVGLLGNMNNSISDSLNNELQRRDEALRLLGERSGIELTGPFLPLPWSVRSRALAKRLEPRNPLRPPDSNLRILRDQWRTTRIWPGYRISESMAMLAWTSFVLAAPLALVRRAAKTNNSGGVRRLFKALSG